MTQIICFTLSNKYYRFLSKNVKNLKKNAWTTIPAIAKWVQGLINLEGNVKLRW